MVVLVSCTEGPHAADMGFSPDLWLFAACHPLLPALFPLKGHRSQNDIKKKKNGLL